LPTYAFVAPSSPETNNPALPVFAPAIPKYHLLKQEGPLLPVFNRHSLYSRKSSKSVLYDFEVTTVCADTMPTNIKETKVDKILVNVFIIV
jgi:hypothetical protein